MSEHQLDMVKTFCEIFESSTSAKKSAGDRDLLMVKIKINAGCCVFPPFILFAPFSVGKHCDAFFWVKPTWRQKDPHPPFPTV